ICFSVKRFHTTVDCYNASRGVVSTRVPMSGKTVRTKDLSMFCAKIFMQNSIEVPNNGSQDCMLDFYAVRVDTSRGGVMDDRFGVRVLKVDYGFCTGGLKIFVEMVALADMQGTDGFVITILFGAAAALGGTWFRR
ncbi:hypothetical protein BGZ47_011243, partial [Haplosporangium gracile]